MSMHQKELLLSQLSPDTASEVACAIASANLADIQAQQRREGDLRVRVLKLSQTSTIPDRSEAHHSLLEGVATIFGRRTWKRLNPRSTERTDNNEKSFNSAFGKLGISKLWKKQSHYRPSEAISVLLRVSKLAVDGEVPSIKEKTAFMSSRSAWFSKTCYKELQPMLTSSESLDAMDNDVVWGEEFLFENVDSLGELQLFCVDRVLNVPHCHLPVRGKDITGCSGYLGRVGISLNRLPMYEEIEQWYPVIARDGNASLVSALKVSLYYTPRSLTHVRFRSLSVPEMMESSTSADSDRYTSRKRFSNESFDRHGDSLDANGSLPPAESKSEYPETLLRRGIIDYVLVVGSGKMEASAHIPGESSILFRYPPTDRQNFRLPTKIEWFCQPNGPEVIKQQNRPRSNLSSFVLSGGSDGLSRSFGICLNVYQYCRCYDCLREKNSDAEASDTTKEIFWHATCICLITRIPLLEEVRSCLLALVRIWLIDNLTSTSVMSASSTSNAQQTRHLEQSMVDLCHGILQPVGGVWGVQFSISTSSITMLLPTVNSKHTQPILDAISSKTPPSLPLIPKAEPSSEHKCIPAPTDSMQENFPPLAYTLAPIFALFNVETIINIMTLTLLEYRIVIHSSNMAVLCPVAEALCTLLYPFRWQHPYVPVLPRYLLDYLQAPLPYILGLHSSWLPLMMDASRPEHLVLVDCDRGCVSSPDNETSSYTDPLRVLPLETTRRLKARLARILMVKTEPYAFGLESLPVVAVELKEGTKTCAWSDQIEQRIRLEFVLFHATVLTGYRDCLFYVNHKLPVFNKHRFLTTCVDFKVLPFVSRLMCTQSFQAFLENHNSAEMDTFHSVYMKVVRSSSCNSDGNADIEAHLDQNESFKRAWYPNVDAGFFFPYYTSNIGIQRAPTTPIFMMPPFDTTQLRESGLNDEDGRLPGNPRTKASTIDILTEENQSLAQRIAEIERLLDTCPDIPIAAACDEETYDWNLGNLFSLEITALDGWEQDVKSFRNIQLEHLCEYFQIDANAFLNSVLSKDESQGLRAKHLYFSGDCNSLDSTDSRLCSPIPVSSAMGTVMCDGWSRRHTSPLEQHIEQLLYRSLTAIFSSDVSLSQEELNVRDCVPDLSSLTSHDSKSCENHFRHGYARDLFVLILMQPGHRFVAQATSSGNVNSTSTTWYNPKGSGSCIGEGGFQILVRLSSYLMNECDLHEDFNTARRMLKVASHYYHLLDDSKSQRGFARKEYLVSALKLCPVCQSLDMWQHAFTHDLEGAMLFSNTNQPSDYSSTLSNIGKHPRQSQLGDVSDEVFFSVSGNLIYSMLMVEVPVRQVQSFVSVMCTAYNKADELAVTLKKLVDNVSRALELSKSSEKITCQSTRQKRTSPILKPSERPPSPLRYDLDTVIKRKVSSCPDPLPYPTPSTTWSPRMDSCEETQARLGARLLRNLRADGTRVVHHCYTSISCMAALPDRVIFGLSTGTVIACDPHQTSSTQVSRSVPADSNILQLDGHLDVVRTLQTRDDIIVSGSQDGTLRVWSFSNCARKRGLFSFLSTPTHSESREPTSTGSRLRHHVPGSLFGKEHKASPSSSGYPTTSLSLNSIDTNEISRKCLLLRGHRGPITCAELGSQVTTDHKLLFSGSEDTTIRIWDTIKDKPLASFSNGRGSLSCLRFLPHRDYLVSGCSSHSLKMWDLGALKLKHNFIAHHGGLRDIQATGDRIITAANDRTAKVWDLHFRSGQQYTHALRDHGGPVTCIAIGGPAEFNICTGSTDGVVRIWDLRYLAKGPHFALQSHRGSITCLQRDFTKLISAGEDGSLCAWNIRTGTCLKHVKAHISGITSIAFMNPVVFSASWDGSVCLWSLDVD
uniref:Uncharacterized protein AlNc14C183G8266 n=1 Tax=Albugo laibachii Nc14 TaxID=890382 RepID=F0W1U9_9STRA|nr:conserved hypothetical protein [Albugo laibachii Nc14]CCA23167.1 conserved hypothetical protein [Albugo laibachii Nc14]|eukprot:CCA23167.1 conserved hypothetical protein [Albugo laibachii Nc14]